VSADCPCRVISKTPKEGKEKKGDDSLREERGKRALRRTPGTRKVRNVSPGAFRARGNKNRILWKKWGQKWEGRELKKAKTQKRNPRSGEK